MNLDEWNGVSFFGHTVVANYMMLVNAFGEPTVTNGDKTNFEWFRYTPRNIPFIVYDYKLGFKPSRSTMVEFHIGAHSEAEAFEAMMFVKKLLK